MHAVRVLYGPLCGSAGACMANHAATTKSVLPPLLPVWRSTSL